MSGIICPKCGKAGMNADHAKRCIGKGLEANQDRPQSQNAPESVAKAGKSKKSLKLNPAPSEEAEQVRVADWLRAHNIFFLHVPNGEIRPSFLNKKGERYCPSGARLYRLGATAGCPDLLIFTYAPHRPNAQGVFIEMKRHKGGKMSEAQRDFCLRLMGCGWEGKRCNGADEAISFLTELGYDKRR